MKDFEKLKDKNYVRAFGLMKPEEQECFEQVKAKNCLWYHGNGNDGWARNSGASNKFDKQTTYAIKPGYQLEPEPLYLPITHDGGFLCIYREDAVIKRENFPHSFIPISRLPDMPNFEGFYLTHGDKVEVTLEWVARYFPNVVAKFRR